MNVYVKFRYSLPNTKNNVILNNIASHKLDNETTKYLEWGICSKADNQVLLLIVNHICMF